jgi:predicted lipid-binding transport protein (Tim44 family)
MNTWMNRAMTLALGAAVALTTLAVPQDADAKRLGAGRSQGMQRDMPARQAPDAPPAKPAQPAQGATPGAPAAAAAGTAAAAAGKRSWLGPIAGLAAGLGLAALFSSMGLGAELANFVMLALLGVAAFFLVRFLMARFGRGAGQNGPAMANAAAGTAAGNNSFRQAAPQPVAPAKPAQPVFVDERPAAFKPVAEPASSTVSPAAPVAAAANASTTAPVTAAFVPAAFDSEGFARIAKMIFIRMQTANDAGDLNDLRRFTTPEMFAAIRLDIQDRNGALQTTDVVKVDAQVLDVADESDRQIVSVRFTGQVVEETGAAPTSFDEIWHLVKEAGSADSAWAIAGIEQNAKA